MSAWRVWYDDGRVIDSSMIHWEHLPREGVQVVMRYLDYPNRMVIMGEDEFVIPGEGVVLRGRWLPDADYARIVDKAMGDMRWPDPSPEYRQP